MLYITCSVLLVCIITAFTVCSSVILMSQRMGCSVLSNSQKPFHVNY